MKVIDPVCKMAIEDKHAVATATYMDTTYHFCSEACKEHSDKDPLRYLLVRTFIPPKA